MQWSASLRRSSRRCCWEVNSDITSIDLFTKCHSSRLTVPHIEVPGAVLYCDRAVAVSLPWLSAA